MSKQFTYSNKIHFSGTINLYTSKLSRYTLYIFTFLQSNSSTLRWQYKIRKLVERIKQRGTYPLNKRNSANIASDWCKLAETFNYIASAVQRILSVQHPLYNWILVTHTHTHANKNQSQKQLFFECSRRNGKLYSLWMNITNVAGHKTPMHRIMKGIFQ